MYRSKKSLFLSFAVLQAGMVLMLAAVPVQAALPSATPVPDPHDPPIQSTPTPVNPPPVQPGTLTQIFKVVFSAETLSDAIAGALASAAEDEADNLAQQTGLLAAVFDVVVAPPEDGYFAAISASSLKTAAALAPVLFALRLAVFHWRRMIGEDDGLPVVVGDWAAAGFMAAAAGPFLDLLVQAGWWAAGAAVGESGALVKAFLSATEISNQMSLLVTAKPSIFSGIFILGGALGGLIGVVELALAFAVSQAVLFVMAVTAPILAVLGVIPQMRWMRSLWLKSVAVLCLIPVAAGGIFKASIALAAFQVGDGLAGLLFRMLWLWGAAGFVLSLAGILGKATISTAGDAARKLILISGQVMSMAGGAGSAGGSGFGQKAAPNAAQPGDRKPASGRDHADPFQKASFPKRSPTDRAVQDPPAGRQTLAGWFESRGLERPESGEDNSGGVGSNPKTGFPLPALHDLDAKSGTPGEKENAFPDSGLEDAL